jgi:hypothetical protein
MISAWHFREQHPDEKVRNPIQGELFSDNAIDKPAQALVRESIQNSLDARSDPAQQVTVRFYLSGQEKALSADRAKAWLGGAWDHFRAPGNGLGEIDVQPGKCPFLVVEDFGTTGLEGDPQQWQPPKSNNDNRFFAFFRAEGLSAKSGQQGGRWGVGKTVFPRSSRTNSFFGLTVRRSDQQKLMLGQTTLFYHNVKEKPYAPDGYFGKPRNTGLVLPVEDAKLLREFEHDFVLLRGNEAGLSVVVPYVDDQIVPEDLVRAVIQEYFQPILLGRLLVRIHSPNSGPLELSTKTLSGEIQKLGAKIGDGLRSAVELAIWARDHGARHRVLLKDTGTPPTWSAKAVSTDNASKLSQEYQQGMPLSLRVPVRVRQKNKPTRDSFFDVYIRRAIDSESFLPFYIRNGIIIPDVRQRQVRGHRMLALVLADDEPLAGLLGDSEPPAHTHWSKQTQKFEQAGYTDGVEVLNFVSDAPRQIAELLTHQQQQKDEFLLADLFPRPEADGVSAEGGGKKGGKTIIKPPPPPAPPQPFEVEQLVGGFRVTRNLVVKATPSSCRVAVAYDTSRGNALRRYKSLDFRLAELEVDVRHGKVNATGNNTLEVSVANDQFALRVTGFDPKRDLYVAVQEDEA